MGLFQKVSQGATALFNKVSDPSFLRKVGNTSRKIDNSVARVGSFLTPVLNSVGLNSVSNLINKGVNTSHLIHNSLEKAISAPMDNVRQSLYH